MTFTTAVEVDPATAELRAIQMALILLRRDLTAIRCTHDPSRVVIYADNSEAIRTLHSHAPGDYTALAIKRAIAI